MIVFVKILSKVLLFGTSVHNASVFQFIRGSAKVFTVLQLKITPRANVSNDFLFGGVFMDHYGHFLLENLSRVYSATPKEVIVFLGKEPSVPGYVYQVLKNLGIKNEVQILRLLPTQTRVASPGFVIRRYFSDNFADFLKSRCSKSSAFEDGQRNKIWLSRSRLEKSSGLYIGEKVIERNLVRLGWKIVHAQDLALDVLISTINAAYHIAGIQGSAFHNLLLTPNFSGKISIYRIDSNLNFDLIFAKFSHNYINHTLIHKDICGWRSRRLKIITEFNIDGVHLSIKCRYIGYLTKIKFTLNATKIFNCY